MEYSDFLAGVKSVFSERLEKELGKLEPAYRPKESEWSNIIDASFEYAFPKGFFESFYEDVKDNLPSSSELEKWSDWDPTSRRNRCIWGATATAVAICSLWVASGGTLTIAFILGNWTLASTSVASAVYAALIGGGGAAAVASAMCPD